MGTEAAEDQGGRRASSQAPARAALPAGQEQRPGLQSLLVPHIDGGRGGGAETEAV